MLSSNWIINTYSNFKVFNIWDKYKYTPDDFVFSNDWYEICDDNRINTLITTIANIKHYQGNLCKLSNGICIEIGEKNYLVQNYLLSHDNSLKQQKTLMKWFF